MLVPSNVVKLYKPSEYKRYQHEKTENYIDSAYFVEVVNPDTGELHYFKLGTDHDSYVEGNESD